MPIGWVSFASPQACPVSVLLFRQFLPATQVSGAALALWITTRVTVNNLVAFTNWTLACNLLLRRFRSASAARPKNVAFAAMLVAVAIWMLLR